jgi:hypothetical protein
MEAIPTTVQVVLDLFATALADVRFADVDAQTLARLAVEVQSASENVASAEAVLEGARRALEERQEVLLHHVQRAVAYARVYAENDEALSRRLNEVSLPRPARRPRTHEHALVLSSDPQPALKTRGRPRKSAAPELMLAGVASLEE